MGADTGVGAMIVRAATLADADSIIRMGERFVSEGGAFGAGVVTLNVDAMRRTLAAVLNAPSAATVLVADVDRLVVGMLGLITYDHPITGERTATEVCWWVEPEWRGAGVRLMRVAERWARQVGATVLQVAAPNAEVERLYERMKFAKVETLYQKRVS